MRKGRRTGRRSRAALAIAGCAALAAAASAVAAGPTDTAGKTTLEQTVVGNGDPAAGYQTLSLGPGEPYIVREEGVGTAQPGRDARRKSLIYFGQFSDLHLPDEESPARVETLIDPVGGPFTAAWRAQEALAPDVINQTIKQMNAYAGASPVADGDGSRAAMDMTLITGDSADSQQRNETEWIVRLLEGGELDPNSGIDPTGYLNPLCPPALIPGAAEAAKYTGVQDYDDYLEEPHFYDPDNPIGQFAQWPRYPGLMDRAQEKFNVPGLDVPSYISFGNHDALAQGNAASNAAFELVATGCLKPMVPGPSQDQITGILNPAYLTGLLTTSPQNLIFVPPDPKRQYVSKPQYKALYATGQQPDAHGFGLVDSAENAASNGAAGYYSWSPKPGFRFIALDTASEAGIVGPSAEGNIDDPQFQWLQGELQKAKNADQLVVLFGHHPIRSLSATTALLPDELAPPCTIQSPLPYIDTTNGHDINPGCDLDPRISSPIHDGQDLTDLLHQYPNAIAYVAGHTHENKVTPFPAPNGGFWGIESTTVGSDWTQQSRLLQVMDNDDGTLSIFGTILDQGGQVQPPPSGTNASTMSEEDLASISRELSFNDAQAGPATGQGEAIGRNVELLLDDPLDGVPPPGPPGGGGGGGGTGGGEDIYYYGDGIYNPQTLAQAILANGLPANATLSCNRAAKARQGKRGKCSLLIRVRCPASSPCRYKLTGLAKGRKSRAATRKKSVRVAPGKTKKVALRVKRKFVASYLKRKNVTVRAKVTVRDIEATVFKKLKLVKK